jgi:ATP-dependent Clp protease ATP-binding subunit ClpX
MLDLMYEVPSDQNIKEVVVNEDVILRKEKPTLLMHKQVETA